mmetsp:Transcript_68197/g.121578  ORF Transcript_68197/g.121578 Transcript_68197/m.121578 type:complete len:660 (-) Transcript_68197:98-2077(-)
MSLDLDDEEDAPEPEWMQIVTEAPAKVQEEAAAGEDEGESKVAEDPGQETAAAEKPLVDEAGLKEFAASEMMLEETVTEVVVTETVTEEVTMEEAVDVAAVKEATGQAVAAALDALLASPGLAMEEEATVNEPVLKDDKAAVDAASVKGAVVAEELEDSAMGETAAQEAPADEAPWEDTWEADDTAMSLSKPVPAAGVKRPAPAETRPEAAPAAKRAREAEVKAAAIPPLEKLLEQLPNAVRAKFQMLSKRMMLKAEAAQALVQADPKDGQVVLQALASREKVADPTRFVVGSLRKRAEMKAAAGTSEKPAQGQPAMEAGGPKPPKAIGRSKSGSLAGPMPPAPASAGVPKAKVAKVSKASSQAGPPQEADEEAPRPPPAAPPRRPPPQRTPAGGPKTEVSPSVMNDFVRSPPSAASRPAAPQKKKEQPKAPAVPSTDAADAGAEDKKPSTAPEKPTAAAAGKKSTGASFQKESSDFPAEWEEEEEERPWGKKQTEEERPWGKKTGASWDKQGGSSWDKSAGGSWNKQSWGQPELPRIRSATGAAYSAAPPPKQPEGPPKKKWTMSSPVVAGRPGAPPSKREGLEFEQEAVQEKLMALNTTGVWKAKVPFDDAALSALLKIDAGSALDILADAEGQGAKCRMPSLFVQQQALKVRMASK